jgi:hypothetical protein
LLRPRLVERRQDDRERRRRDHRRTNAPHRARRDKDALDQANPQKSEAMEKMTTPIMKTRRPVQIGKTPGEQEQAAVRDRVGRDDPLQIVAREVERSGGSRAEPRSRSTRRGSS